MQQPGSIIDGKYEVLESLGQGGMGQVLLVRHVHLEERRVVKILRQDMSLEESAQKRFLREARLATQVKHPNVAILYDFSQLEDGRFYMVWEHIDGHHMGLRLQKKGPFAVLPALQLGIQTLRGLEAIHASGVVHRDISPDNLMITRDRRGKRLVKVIDLGLAKTLASDPAHEVTQVGMFMGKLRYCSPEQAEPSRGTPLDRRSDLYSFGLVLYEALCGLEPFEAEMPHTAVMKRLSETPPPVSSRNPELPLPEELDPIFEKALALDREERFANAVEMIEAIEKVGFQLRRRDPARYGASVGRPTRPRGTDETTTLTRAERLDLLAQIQRAGSRRPMPPSQPPVPQSPASKSPVETPPDEPLVPAPVPESTTLDARPVEPVPVDSPPEPARPAAPEPVPVEASPAEEPGAEEGPAPAAVEPEPVPPAAPERSDRERREELEQMLTSYLKSQQLPLAELTLSTLIDLFPYHPRREEYEEWVRMLRDEVNEGARAEEALAAGREALGEGRVKVARKRLAELRKIDPDGGRVEALEQAIEAHDTALRDNASADELRSELEKSLDAGRLDEAQGALDRLSATDTPRVTLDLYRSRLGDARREREQTVRAESFEARYRERIALGDWAGARDVALELERALPIGDRPATMFAEISRLEAEERHLQALEQGVAQVESLLDAGDAAGARMALGILNRMDPNHPRRAELARRVAAADEAG